MKLRSVWIVPFAFASPSCVLYDATLLDGAQGGASLTGGSSGDGDVSGSGGGDLVGDGDDDAATGGSAGGGAPAASGGAATGGDGAGSGATGGTSSGGTGSGGEVSGTGGGVGCEIGTDEKGPLDSVSDTMTVEHFDIPWSTVGDGDPFDGNWIVGGDSSGSGLAPTVGGGLLPKSQDPCLAEGDTSLHVTGNGYTTWGASYDANLDANTMAENLSAYDGVALWVKTGLALQQIKLGFTDESGTEESTVKPILSSTWTSLKVPFPNGTDPGAIQVISIVVVAGEEFDLWVDDLTLYAD